MINREEMIDNIIDYNKNWSKERMIEELEFHAGEYLYDCDEGEIDLCYQDTLLDIEARHV